MLVAVNVVEVPVARGWRRVALRNVGAAVLVVGLLVLLLQRLIGKYLVDEFVKVQDNRDVTAEVWSIATQLLRDIGRNSVAVGLFVVLAATLVGSSRPARAVRRFIAPVFVGHPGRPVGSAAVLFLLLVLWSPLPVLETWRGALIAAVLMAIAVEALRRRCERDATRALIDEEVPRTSAAGRQPRIARVLREAASLTIVVGGLVRRDLGRPRAGAR